MRAIVDDISTELENLGLPAVKKNANFRAALIHLGNELVKNEFVSLSTKAGQSLTFLDCILYIIYCFVYFRFLKL